MLQLRDAGGKLAVGLGEAAGTLRVSSKDGLRITTAKGGVEEAFPRALRIIGAAGRGPARPSTIWRVQIKAVRDESAALALRQQVEADSGVSSYVVEQAPWYKIQVGNAASMDEAEILKAKLQELGYQDAWITRVEIPGENAADKPRAASRPSAGG